MATIRKKGERWQAQVRRIGHKSQTKSFVRRSDAETWARQTEVKLDEGVVVNVRRELRSLTLGELLTRYLSEFTCKKRGYIAEANRIRMMLKLPISKVTLDRLSASEISSYMRIREINVIAATLRREMAIIKHCLQVARTHWNIRLSSNPFEGIKMPNAGVPRRRRVANLESKALSVAISNCRNPLIRYVFEFAIITGMRRGEILSLRWADVDISSATAHLRQTKNGEARKAPLSPQAIQTLLTLAEMQNARPEPSQSHHGAFQVASDLVFPISANALRLAWERAKKRAGIKDLRFHDLRHEAISRFFEMGLSVPEVALISGHKDPRMLFRYTHLRAENVAQKLNALSGCNPAKGT